MDNVTTINQTLKKFKYMYLGDETELSFDERYLYEDWKKSVEKGKSTYLLYRLSPNIVEKTLANDDSLKTVRTGWLLILSSIIIYFSDYNSSIPLLAPALLCLGVIFIIVNLKKRWPRTWALVYDDYNYEQVRMLIPEDEDAKTTEQRKQFTNSLITAIEEAKKKEFYSDE